MIIKSVKGKTLVKTDHKTIRQTLEWCAQEGVDLTRADLRKAKLSHASLDGLQARGACLWGADLTNADIGFSDLRQADLRCGMFKDTCFAESDLSQADLQGGYFSGTIVDGTRLDRAIVSCPSFWDCDLQNCCSIEGLVYNHLGERPLTLSSYPLVIKGFPKRLVLIGGYGLWGNDLYCAGDWPVDAERFLFSAKITLERTMFGSPSHSAKKAMRKIQGAGGIF